jgi:hypothetical protein
LVENGHGDGSEDWLLRWSTFEDALGAFDLGGRQGLIRLLHSLASKYHFMSKAEGSVIMMCSFELFRGELISPPIFLSPMGSVTRDWT